MSKSYFTARQGIFTLTLFILGSSVVMGGFSELGQDSWIPLIVSQVFTFPLVLMFARIMQLSPEQDIFDIIFTVLPKFIGKVLTLFITWYSIHLTALVMRNYSEFVQISYMQETPQLALMILLVFLVIYLVKSPITTLGKWSIISLLIVILILSITLALLANLMDFSNLFPVMNHGTKEILNGAYKLFTFPFAESVLFLAVADSIRKSDNPYKVYLSGISIGAVILLIAILRNILSLGPAMMQSTYFPSYIAVRIINIGDFLVRIEGSMSINFLLAGVTKMAISLIAAAKGLAHLFNIQDYKKMILPAGLLSLSLCAILYTNVMEMVNFLSTYSIYAIPFVIIIPMIIWIADEIKARPKRKNKQSNFAEE